MSLFWDNIQAPFFTRPIAGKDRACIKYEAFNQEKFYNDVTLYTGSKLNFQYNYV